MLFQILINLVKCSRLSWLTSLTNSIPRWKLITHIFIWVDWMKHLSRKAVGYITSPYDQYEWSNNQKFFKQGAFASLQLRFFFHFSNAHRVQLVENEIEITWSLTFQWFSSINLLTNSEQVSWCHFCSIHRIFIFIYNISRFYELLRILRTDNQSTNFKSFTEVEPKLFVLISFQIVRRLQAKLTIGAYFMSAPFLSIRSKRSN